MEGEAPRPTVRSASPPASSTLLATQNQHGGCGTWLSWSRPAAPWRESPGPASAKPSHQKAPSLNRRLAPPALRLRPRELFAQPGAQRKATPGLWPKVPDSPELQLHPLAWLSSRMADPWGRMGQGLGAGLAAEGFSSRLSGKLCRTPDSLGERVYGEMETCLPSSGLPLAPATP